MYWVPVIVALFGDNRALKLGRRYDLPLSLVTFFIILTWVFIQDDPRYALLWACAAMGIQNAMLSYDQGAIIRTTHLSGVLTDLGLALGYYVKGLNNDAKKILLHLLILFGVICGSVIAALSYPYLQLQTLFIAADLSLMLSLIYWVLYFRYSSLQK